MKARTLLWPLSLLYGAITGLRNFAFDRGWLRSTQFEIPVISVGNLSTGGTGKTPMVEFLIEKLRDQKLGFVSRGYGRQSKGLIMISPEHSPAEIGDEPYQIFQKSPRVTAAVSEKRVEGIQAVIGQASPEIILLDDAFQHRYVKPKVNLLLTTYQKPFYKDQLLPAGNLRESKTGKSRADIIVVTKCPPEISAKEKEKMLRKIRPKSHQSVFFSSLDYAEPVNLNGKKIPESQENVTVLSGIANPTLFLAQLHKHYKIADHLQHPDHHLFTKKDLEKIRQAQKPIITTEKDWVRLKSVLTTTQMEEIFYLPIKVRILFGEEDQFLQALKSQI